MEQKIEGSVPLRSIIIGVVVAIAAVGVWFVSGVGLNPKNPGSGEVVAGGDTFRPENAAALATVEGGTREQVEEDMTAPEPGDTPSNPSIAVPTSVSGSGPKFRVFSIAASDGKFIPSTIIVGERDVIDLTIVAADADYDVFFPDFGVYKKIESGTSGKVQFQGTPYGSYVFTCRDACPSGSASGQLIILPE